MGKFPPPRLEELRIPENPLLRVRKELEQLGIKGIFRRLGVAEVPKLEGPQFPSLSRELILKGLEVLEKGGMVAVEILELEGKLGIGVGWLENRGVVGGYLVGNGEELKVGAPLLTKSLLGHSMKEKWKLLNRYLPTPLQTPVGDLEVLGWLLSPDQSNSLESLGNRFLPGKIPPIPKKITPTELPTLLRGRVEGILKLFPKLKAQLWSEVLPDWEGVELPLVPLLFQIERRGIGVDPEKLEELKREIGRELEEIEGKIYQLAGEKVNLNSHKQLQYLLFERLGLPPKKRTKTGFSTDESVLKQLKSTHPVIPLLLQYRKLVKLLNTYIDPLLHYLKETPTNRIYTTFLQTGTATGRLSSRNPNLQNIPISDRWNIRDAFVTEKLFLSLDYSQIELRLLAHYSEDPHLLEGFRRGADIHIETARKLFPEAPEKYRGVAKSINFGLIYGMGPKKLAETIGVSQKVAKEFIERYFQTFPKVREFIKKAHRELKEREYVETLFHRRRFFPISQARGALLASYLREGLNTIFQGSAADLIKKAMVQIQQEFPENRLILQIHDELLFEVERPEEGLRYREIMESVVQLKVPLKVEIKVGKRWGSLEKWAPTEMGR
ncbi:MAG: DNA polymerase [Campylobacterales bacterium]